MIIDIPQEAIMIASMLGLLEVSMVFGTTVWFVRRTLRVRARNRHFNRRLAQLA